jgi:hypothetical protein
MRLVSTVTQRAVAGLGDRGADLAQQVVDLGAAGADLDRRVDQPGGADHLFGEDAAGLLHLPVAGGGRDGDGLRAHRVPFLEAQRPVVEAGRQPEAVFGQRRLAAEVAAVHAADLRDRTWLSSMKTSALSGMYSNSVGGGSPGLRPVR